MFYLDHRLTIIIGAYGSGKSEIAVNMSLAQRKALPDKKLLIADLDIVNPFYRSSDCASALEAEGIRLVTPMYAGSNVDAPVQQFRYGWHSPVRPSGTSPVSFRPVPE